ncbi:hypothetical protein [Mesorhizobium sp. M0138]|uniref:hypothetical protein n=1 Tax=Mesorhizobium sp. M0138 TaxID=2956891 RepID=UPI00333DA26E
MTVQTARPELRSTVGWYPFERSSTIGLKSIFVDETDIGRINRNVVLSMPADQRSTAAYEHAYIMKGLTSAPVTRSKGTPISHPNLREMVGLFVPAPSITRGNPYPSSDIGFLADAGAKRQLIKEAPMLAKVRRADRVPMAVFGLRQQHWISDYNANERLRERCDAVIFDATSMPFGHGKDWLRDLKKVHQFLAALGGHKPALVVLSADPWFARRAAEVLSARLDIPLKITATVKSRPIDFSAAQTEQQRWTDCTVKVHVRDLAVAQFRKPWIEQAGHLRKRDMDDAADAILMGITFLRNIACLPVGFRRFRATHDRLVREGVRPEALAAYTYSSFHTAVTAAAASAGSLGQDLIKFRDTIGKMANQYLETTDVAEVVKEAFKSAARKSNRTLAVFRDPVMLAAIEDWIAAPDFPSDPERIAEKVILATPDTFGAMLATIEPGAPVDTMLIVHPTSRAAQRMVFWPTLPRHVDFIGDGGALGALRSAFAEAAGIFEGPPGERIAAVLAALDEHRESLIGFDFEQVIAPEFKGGKLIDLTAGTASPGKGPVTEIATEDGYLLRVFPTTDVLVRQDDAIDPFHKVEAKAVREGDHILVVTADLYERLDSILGPVEVDKNTISFLKMYHDAVAKALSAIGGGKQYKIDRILEKMRQAATELGYPGHAFGQNERQNVLRWMNCGKVSGRPDAPRSALNYKCWIKAIGVSPESSELLWRFGVVNSRVQAIQAGLQESARSLEFVVRPEPFYRHYPDQSRDLRELREEISRRFSIVCSVMVLPTKPERSISSLF